MRLGHRDVEAWFPNAGASSSMCRGSRGPRRALSKMRRRHRATKVWVLNTKASSLVSKRGQAEAQGGLENAVEDETKA
ncbi:hypothetical protein GW17_00046298 [Ensete ventricosum]|nr:hypothetical protein GW17_00046298 [Ensete ventricosum]RZS20375.1 hypothetical protein BHM03_00052874 [Ensete ventricosum]